MAVNVGRCVPKKCNFSLRNKNVRFYCTVIVGDRSETSSEIEFRNAKPFESIPGPKPAPLIGNLWRFFPGIGTYNGLGLHDLTVRLKEEYGNVVKLKGLKFQPDMVNIYNPKDIETVCRNEGPMPNRDALPSVRAYKESRKHAFSTLGLFASDGEAWQETRSTLNPIFMNPRTVKVYSEPIQEVVTDFVQRIKSLSAKDSNQEMPDTFSEEIQKFTLESVSVMVLNMRLGLLENKDPSPESVQFLEDVSSMMEYLYQLDILPSPHRYITTPTYRSFVRTNDRMVQFVQKSLDEAIQKLENGPKTDEKTILEKLLGVDRKYLFATICDTFFAGVDTSASVIKSWMYCVAANPEAQERMRQEVISALPNLDSPVTAEALEKMPLTRAALKEVYRLSNIASGAWRKTANDVVVSGYQLPKGTNVVLCFYASGRNEELFPEPDKFKPERWLREDGKRLVKTNPWVMQPFGFGVRSCIGKRLVGLELEQLFPKIIRNFKMEWHYPPAVYESRLMYGISSPLKIKMIPIES